eukprot:1322828-Amphidinium_carterae.3
MLSKHYSQGQDSMQSSVKFENIANMIVIAKNKNTKSCTFQQFCSVALNRVFGQGVRRGST